MFATERGGRPPPPPDGSRVDRAAGPVVGRATGRRRWTTWGWTTWGVGRYAVTCPAVMALCDPAAAQSLPLLSPNGPVAETQRRLLFEALGVMAVVVVPVFLLFAIFVWRYRAGRNPRDYAPDWDFSPRIDAAVWCVPAVIVVVIGFLQWTRTYTLDPYEPAADTGEPVLQVQAIALDWKWLFLYPEEEVASLNRLVVPAGRPFQVALTSDTVMNAFFVPGLGGQIYVMAGMRTNMNLLADAPAAMWGRNTQFSGAGFSDQDFAVDVVTPADYAAWVAATRETGEPLRPAGYEALRKPSANEPARAWSGFPDGLFDQVIARYGHAVPGHAIAGGS